MSIVNPFFLPGNKWGNYTLFLGLSVPGEGPRRSASALALLASFLNSGGGWGKTGNKAKAQLQLGLDCLAELGKNGICSSNGQDD